MNNRKHLQWLYRELPALINEGILTAEAAEKLRDVETKGKMDEMESFFLADTLK